jgi:hypothetical protein
MVSLVLSNVDVLRNLFGFLEFAPQLAAAIVPCSMNVAEQTRLYIPGYSKTSMLHHRASRDRQLRASYKAACEERDNLDDALSESRNECEETQTEYAHSIDECITSTALLEISEAARLVIESDFAEYVKGATPNDQNRQLLALTAALQVRLAAVSLERDRLTITVGELNERLLESEYGEEEEEEE